ncbi:MAG: Uma2 family endonuclease, partial [Microcoleus sp. C1-bin4]|nr:Uma2 family endonuclease [Microcoleus sp. C1-bin4]
ELLFANDPNVFVAGDLLWYPVEGNNKLCQAPDVMVVFGRPKGYRGSYQQWNEDNIPPQVVFEILSPGNRPAAMIHKFKFYERYGVEEYYLYDPQILELTGWQRVEEELEAIEQIDGWISPRLGVRFGLSETGLEMFGPSGEPFVSFVELAQLRQQAEARAQEAETLLEQERSRSQALELRLREMGIDPNQL